MSIAENIQMIRARMAAAAEKAGRDPKEILLVGASKMNGAHQQNFLWVTPRLYCCGLHPAADFLYIFRDAHSYRITFPS